MQPNPTTRPPSIRLAALGLVAAAGLTLAACGGSATSDGSPSEDRATTTADGASGTAGGGSAVTTTAAADDLDLCAELTQSDVEEILGGATLSGAKAQPALTAPNCDYVRTIEGGGMAMDSFVVRVVRNDPSYFDSQKELQTSAVEVPGVDAFAYNDYGTVVARGESGTFEVVRGVEVADGGEVATQDQMIAIAREVQGL